MKQHKSFTPSLLSAHRFYYIPQKLFKRRSHTVAWVVPKSQPGVDMFSQPFLLPNTRGIQSWKPTCHYRTITSETFLLFWCLALWESGVIWTTGQKSWTLDYMSSASSLPRSSREISVRIPHVSSFVLYTDIHKPKPGLSKNEQLAGISRRQHVCVEEEGEGFSMHG